MLAKELARLMRIEHSAMLAIAVLAAELIAKGIPPVQIFLLSLATPVLVSMGAFAINDYFDVEVDRANGMKRPLVEGTVTKRQAVYAAVLSTCAGISASAFINLYALSIAIAFALLAFLYAYKLKEKLFWGNAYIALAMVIPFIYGNYVVSNTLATSIGLISAMIFLAGLAREIHGTIRDLQGDITVRNARTIPKVIGKKAASFLALVLYILAIGISIYLSVYVRPFSMNPFFIVPVAVTDILLIYCGIGYILKPSEGFYKKARNISLFAMALALLGILLSALIQM